MDIRLLMSFFLYKVIHCWNLEMHMAPYVYVGEKLEIKCLVTGYSPYLKMFLYCPVNQLTADQLCFEDCQKMGDSSNYIFHRLDCRLDLNEERKSFIYTIASVNESWLAFNNSNFRCRFMDKSAKVPLVILNKKEKSILKYIDIIIVMGLLVFSLSVNVAFCSWYTQNKKYMKMKKKSKKLQTSIPLIVKEETITTNHQRKCRSLDLPQRREMQQQLLRRNRSVLMLPILVTNKHLSPSPSMSLYNYPFSNEYNPLINKQRGNIYKIDANFNKLNTVIPNQTEQVSSFKSAMDNKISENLTESLLN